MIYLGDCSALYLTKLFGKFELEIKAESLDAIVNYLYQDNKKLGKCCFIFLDNYINETVYRKLNERSTINPEKDLTNVIQFISRASELFDFVYIHMPKPIHLFCNQNSWDSHSFAGHAFNIMKAANWILDYIAESVNISPVFVDLDFHYVSKDYYRFGSLFNLDLAQKLHIKLKTLVECNDKFNSIILKPKKVLCVDLDNTMWGGIIGESGLHGIELGEGTPRGRIFDIIQKMILQYKREGFLIAAITKNEKELACQGLFNHPNTNFREGDFISIKASWNPKSESIIALSKELNLDLNSFVFIDDSSHECSEVKLNIPDIETIKVDENIYKYPDQLRYNINLGTPRYNLDDEERSTLYRRRELRKKDLNEYSTISQSNNINKWLESLEIKIILREINDQNFDQYVQKLEQLFNRTNQFNLNGTRYSCSDISHLSHCKQYKIFAAFVEDKFGYEGLVSSFVVKFSDNHLLIDQFILSCRVFSRNIEFSILDYIIKKLLGEKKLYVSVNSTKKNHASSGFFKNFTNSQMMIELDSFNNTLKNIYLPQIELKYEI